ncbi:MAG: response regulator [Anaerolineae bacterium]|nr:response regulator [Anaerolineae bacterium]
MAEQPDVILIIDDDSQTRSMLHQGVFSADHFDVFEAKNGDDGLLKLRQARPDLIILDWLLPGLAGRDLLVAIKSQGYQGPLIVIVNGGDERSAVEAFRLGATDFITRPVREAEVLAAAERGLAEVRLRRQRDTLMDRLQSTNRQLEARVAELTTLFDIGQSVTAMRDLESLFTRVLEGAISMIGADHAMLLLRDEESGQLILQAGVNMQLAMLDRLGEPIQDQLADLVMTSLEALTVAGDSLRRFALAKDLYAVAYAPLVVQSKAFGVLAVGNHQKQQAFDDEHGRLLKALADYAAIAIINARLFRMMERRAKKMEADVRALQERDAERSRQMQAVLDRLHQPLADLGTELDRVADGGEGKLSKDAGRRLAELAGQARQLEQMIAGLRQRQ